MATTNNGGKTLVVLLGATATGKTDVGIALARAFGSEIVSSDSRQIYREMSIGTAKPTEEELSAVPHHLIGTRSVREDYSAGRYEQDALRVLEERFREHDTLFLVGGSGLYIDAVCYGMDELPAVDPHLRKTLVRRAQTEGLESLFEELRKLDPAHCEVMDRSNPQRVIRALEVCLQSGRPYSSLRKGEPKTRPFRILRVGLRMSRDVLYDRIDRRVDQMIHDGLVDEVFRLKEMGYTRELVSMQGLGYKELFPYLAGECSLEEAIYIIKRDTRHFAKRQLTWFRREKDVIWLNKPDFAYDEEKILSYMLDCWNETVSADAKEEGGSVK